MLNLPQLGDIKAKDPNLFSLLTEVVKSINQGSLFAGIDPHTAPHVPMSDALPAPARPASVTVATAGGYDFVRIGPALSHNDLTNYVAEVSATSDFKNVIQYFLGNARQGVFPTGSFWRVAAKLPMSKVSDYLKP